MISPVEWSRLWRSPGATVTGSGPGPGRGRGPGPGPTPPPCAMPADRVLSARTAAPPRSSSPRVAPPLLPSPREYTHKVLALSADDRFLAWQTGQLQVAIVLFDSLTVDAEAASASSSSVLSFSHLHCPRPITCLAFAPRCHGTRLRGEWEHPALDGKGDSDSDSDSDSAALAVGHDNGSITLWDVRTEALITKLLSHTSDLTDMCFTGGVDTWADIGLITVSRDTTLKVRTIAYKPRS